MIFYRKIGVIRAMTFDLDDTLYDNMPYIYAAEAALSQYITEHYPNAASISKEQWFTFKQCALQNSPVIKYDMGRLRLATLRLGFASVGYADDTLEAAAHDCFTYFYAQRSNFTVPKHYTDVLASLAGKIPLVAITNGNVNVDTIGIGEYFTHVYHASIDHRAKPHSDMFVKASQALGIAPQYILHVGDNMINDVLGAYQNGYKSAWYAADRPMNMSHEPVKCLPDVQLDRFSDLLHWV